MKNAIMKDFFEYRELLEASKDWKSEPPEVHRDLDKSWMRSGFRDPYDIAQEETEYRADRDGISHESAFEYFREEMAGWINETPTYTLKSRNHKKLVIGVNAPYSRELDTDSFLIHMSVNNRKSTFLWEDHGIRNPSGKPLCKKIAEYFERKLWEEEPTLMREI